MSYGNFLLGYCTSLFLMIFFVYFCLIIGYLVRFTGGVSGVDSSIAENLEPKPCVVRN